MLMRNYQIPTLIFENKRFSVAIKMELNAAFFLYFSKELHFHVLESLLKMRDSTMTFESLQKTTFPVANILPTLSNMESNKLECLFIYSYLCYLAFKQKKSSIIIDNNTLTKRLSLSEDTVRSLIHTLIDCNFIRKEAAIHHYLIND